LSFFNKLASLTLRQTAISVKESFDVAHGYFVLGCVNSLTLEIDKTTNSLFKRRFETHLVEVPRQMATFILTRAMCFNVQSILFIRCTLRHRQSNNSFVVLHLAHPQCFYLETAFDRFEYLQYRTNFAAVFPANTHV